MKRRKCDYPPEIALASVTLFLITH